MRSLSSEVHVDKMVFFELVLIISSVNCVVIVAHETEPTCLSRFDYDYKVMSKLIALETENTRLNDHLEKLTDKLGATERKVEVTENLVHLLEKVASLDGTGTTYIRWGRSSCPSNGTELVYEGFAAGSWYSHSGAASEYLCLPTEPIWDNYEDGVSDISAFVYGAEYQLDQRTIENFFGKNLYQNDAPCAVCRTKRASKLMIPGRNQCYDGWTKEYHGYLTGGYYGHDAASEFVCLDVDAEALPKGAADENGKLFFFAEARCGSLRCPAYVNGRELTCVVCSK